MAQALPRQVEQALVEAEAVVAVVEAEANDLYLLSLDAKAIAQESTSSVFC